MSMAMAVFNHNAEKQNSIVNKHSHLHKNGPKVGLVQKIYAFETHSHVQESLSFKLLAYLDNSDVSSH